MLPQISKEDVLLAIEHKIGHRNFTILSQALNPVEEKTGLLGDHYILTISIQSNVNNQETLLNFFVKAFPVQEALAEFASASGAFEKEEFSYKLFETYEHNLIRNCVANCYLIQPNKYLILENLGEYIMPNKYECLTYENILVILRHLAQFHASTLIFEEKSNKKIIEGNEKIFQDCLYRDGAQFANKNAIASTLNCILFEIDYFKFPKKMSSAAETLYKKIFDLVKPSKKFRNVLCHGDLWASNLMLKPDGCKFVDFQSIRYVPPSHDVLSLIFSTTSRDFRKNHLYELLGIYYNYLEKILKISGYNLDKILPFQEFLESCEEQKLFAILSAAGIIPLILSKRELIEKYYSDKELYYKVFREDRSVLIIDNEDNDVFMTRAKESIEDLIEECTKFCEIKNC
ncbi:unnamed protein product [Ceutorhynchus assimilis]|uniref:CHK kinase-like domain-containing protein n=1 Tax=Ceutorhynchus assimilis TaxID=467358 RepID=A0A9N9MSC7_9CUCU|nr:unnamed protein product [Ceutorhynchus assimilis]